MTPEQFQEFLAHNEVATGAAIEKYVNGKIRAVDAKIDSMVEWSRLHSEAEKSFQARIEPYLTGVETTDKIMNLTGRFFYSVGKLVIWIAAVVGAAYVIKNKLF